MKINLTLNKPAATSFLSGGDVAGLKVKIDGKRVLFKASRVEKGAGVFPLFNRTRGGIGITLDGRFAEQFLAATGLERGSHLKLEPTSYKWMAAEAVPMGTKPSKVVPTARLWRAIDEVQGKEESAPAKKAKAPAASRGTKAKPAAAAKPAKAAAKKGATGAAAKKAKGTTARATA